MRTTSGRANSLFTAAVCPSPLTIARPVSLTSAVRLKVTLACPTVARTW
jgi:hypothetical protein